MRVVVTILLFFVCCSVSIAQNYVIEGKVTNYQGGALAFVPIFIDGTTNGTITNENGVYQLKVPPGSYTVNFRFIGYQHQSQEIVVVDQNVKLDMELEPENFTRDSVITNKAGPDSAYSIMHKVIAKRKFYLKQVDKFSSRIYIRADQRILEAPNTFVKADVAKVLNLNPDRRGLISLYESISDFTFKSPDRFKEVMVAQKTAGGENAFGLNRATDLQINLYQNQLRWGGISTRPYISPIAKSALHYYRYKLLQKFTDNNDTIDVIQVYPKRENEHVFHGVIYIIENQWKLYGVNLSLYKSSHIDFVDTLNMREQYIPVTDSVSLPLSVNINFSGKVLGFKYGGSFVGVANNYKIGSDVKFGLFTGADFVTTKETNKRDSAYWATNRGVPLLDDEKRYYHLYDVVRRDNKNRSAADSIKNNNNSFRLLPYLVKGYKYNDPFNKINITFPEPLKIVFYNTIEGLSFDFRPQFLKEYKEHKTLSVEPELRYGKADKILTFNTKIDYRYNPLKQAAVYGSFGSDFLDLNNSGTISLFLNSLSTLLTGNNYLKLYLSKFASAGTQGEVHNGILLNGQIEFADRKALNNITTHTLNKDSTRLTVNNPLASDPFNDTTLLFPRHKALSLRASVTFTFDQRFSLSPDGKFIEPSKYPRLRFNYRKGIKAFSSIVDYDFASVDVFQDQLKVGIYGYSSFFVSAGKFFNNTVSYYPDWKQFRGGQSFLFDSSLGSFHFLNFYTYSTNKQYMEAHYEHNFTGFFLGQVPLIRKLNLEEIVGGSYLKQGVLPDYKEFYFGIKRSVVRVDYGFSYGMNTPILQGFRFTYSF